MGAHLDSEENVSESQQLEFQNLLTKSVDDKVKYKCLKCPKEMSEKRNLRKHVQTQHNGVRYTCDLCDYVGDGGNLNYHKKAEHYHRYPYKCPNCEKTFSENSNLWRHRKSQHEGITYQCHFCKYKAKQTTHLKTHIKTRHQEAIDNMSGGKVYYYLNSPKSL